MENEITPFCNRRWKLPAVVMVLACLATFFWGFHLLSDYSEWKLESDFLPSGSSATAQHVGANVIEQLSSVIRQTVASVGSPIPGGATGMPQLSKTASGTIINPEGHIVTTLHSVSGLKEIAVIVETDMGLKQYQAKIVKVVPSHNLALLKIISNDVFPFIAIGDSQVLQTGETVYALGIDQGESLVAKMGNVFGTGTNLNLGETLFTNLIQTDAVYRWSQSGGPLLNSQGIMVGVNIAVSSPNGGIVGYAVPSHIVVAHFQDIAEFMTATNMAPQTATPNVGNNRLQNRQAQNLEPMENEMGANAALTRRLPAQGATTTQDNSGKNEWWQMAKALIERQNTMITPTLQGTDTRPFDLGLNAAVTQGQSPIIDSAHTGRWTLWGYSIDSILGLLALGFIAGICGGAMTMGGGIVKVTGLMLLFGYGMILVRPVAYITNIFLYGSAALRYKREGLILMDKVRRLIPWAMGGVVLGYFLGNHLGSFLIHYLLGLFAISLGIKIVMEIVQSKGESSGPDETIRQPESTSQTDSILDRLINQDGSIDRAFIKEVLLGVPMGVISGILGISGGVVEVPMQNYVTKIPLKNAIANSSVMVFFASLVGSVVAMIHGVSIGAFSWETPVILALILTPGAYFGGMVGAWLTKVTPINMLKWVYALFMFAIAIRMFIQ